MTTAKNDSVPVLIDNGARWMVRDRADDFDDAIGALEDLVALCPAGAYPVRSDLRKDPTGARVYVTVVFQVRGEPLESRREIARKREG
jgi:hypothetical protein